MTATLIDGKAAAARTIAMLLRNTLHTARLPYWPPAAWPTAAGRPPLWCSAQQARWSGHDFAATAESTVSPAAQQRMTRAGGDDTLATRVHDDVRGVEWPPDYTSRVLHSSFTDLWHRNGSGRVPPEHLGEAAARFREGTRHDDPHTGRAAVGRSG